VTRAIIAGLLLLALAACEIAPNEPGPAGGLVQPDYVQAVDSARVLSGTPADSAEDWLLAHLDMETTGLVPGYHEPIDLGLVITDRNGAVLDSLFLRLRADHPERLSAAAAQVNGYSVERWRDLGALGPRAAGDSLFAFHRRVAAERPVLLVAFNSQFDTAFLDHLLRSTGRSWRQLYHYFVLDIPSMAWARGYRELENAALAERLGVADEPRTATEHTGITGALLNVRIYQALMQHAGAAHPAPSQ